MFQPQVAEPPGVRIRLPLPHGFWRGYRWERAWDLSFRCADRKWRWENGAWGRPERSRKLLRIWQFRHSSAQTVGLILSLQFRTDKPGKTSRNSFLRGRKLDVTIPRRRERK